RSVNPFDQSLVAEYASDDAKTLEKKLTKANEAFGLWKKEGFEQRGGLMRRAGDILLNEKSRYARIIATEMGKVLTEAEGEIEKCAGVCHFYAEQASSFLGDRVIQTQASKSYIAWQPLGPVLAIMPWNFPFWQVF